MTTVPKPWPPAPALLLRSHVEARISASLLLPAQPESTTFAGASWSLELSTREENADKASPKSSVCQLQAKILEGTAVSVSAGLRVDFPDWSPEHYLLFPGAVYGGNRFRSASFGYPPKPPLAWSKPDCPPFVADIPRLDDASGLSRIQLLSSGMSWPACAVFDPHQNRACLILAPSHAEAGQIGFDFEENDARNHATLSLTAPGVRETTYDFCALSTQHPSSDRGVTLATGQAITFEIRILSFPCASLAVFFEHVFAQARAAALDARSPCELPLSAAHQLIEEHYNRDFWWPGKNLYRVDHGDGNPYQTGWCGGLIAEFALLANSKDPLTRERCRKHLDTALTQGMAPGGLFYGKYNGLDWVSDCWRDAQSMPWRADYTLVRRQGDALLYVLKTLALLDGRGEEIPSTWEAATRRNAEALCEIWERDGQFGQMVHQTENRVLLGNSASGAMVPGALTLAYRRYKDTRFLRVALAAAESLHARFLNKGLTFGGPSDAGQAPDSESCAALLESYCILFDQTGEARWRDHALEAARLAATWVMPYNFPFPAGSEFAHLDIKSLGTVWANAQNKHSAPGICTHSGIGLLRLYRSTGDVRHLDLLRDIARALPQCVSRADRPIHAPDGQALPPGWINERVNTCDWDRNVGGVFRGPCWCEVSAMLTYAELPGVYARTDTRLVRALDNIEASWTQEGRLRLTNPTRFPASVRLLVEGRKDLSEPLSDTWFERAPCIHLNAGSTLELDFP